MTDTLAIAASLPTGLINRFSNGAMNLCPDGAVTGSDTETVFVSYRVLTQSNDVSVSQLTNPEVGQARAMRITQSNATAQRFGLAQTIQAINCQDLRTSPLNATHRARLSAEGRTMFALLEWDGTADGSPADPINDWTSTSYTPGQFFVSSVRVINYGILSASMATWAQAPYIPYQGGISLNNLIYVVWTESAQAQNATLDLGLFQLAQGAQPQGFEYRSDAVERVIPNGNLIKVVATGSTAAITLEDRFGEIVNVKDFGAIGDGSTDDTTAINAAITYANTLTAKNLHFPAGVYNVTAALTALVGTDWSVTADAYATVISSTFDGAVFQIDVRTTTSVRGYWGPMQIWGPASGSYTSSKGIHVLCDTANPTNIGSWTFDGLMGNRLNDLWYMDDQYKILGAQLVGKSYALIFTGMLTYGDASRRCKYGVRFAGAPGQHNLFAHNIFTCDTAGVKIGDGTAGVGDQSFVGGHYNGGDAAFIGIDVNCGTSVGIYNQNLIISGTQMDGTLAKKAHIRNMSDVYMQVDGNVGAPVTLTNCSNYRVQDRMICTTDLNRWNSQQHKWISLNGIDTYAHADGDAGTFTHSLNVIHNKFIGIGVGVTKTIASGIITATQTRTFVDTEGGGAADDLDTISGGFDGAIISLGCVTGARVVTVKHNTGNIKLSGSADFALNSVFDRLWLELRGGFWCEFGRGNNA